MTDIDVEYLEDINNDVCPICKTDKYLNSNMKFLINPECYHKICDSCVDRIFATGPAKCPYKNCDKILRKNKFKTQIFEDISVEKEIDIRNRVFKIYNKQEQDFKNLEDYNSYLEKVENLISNLLNGIDVEKTNEEIQKYKQENSKLIHQNNVNLVKQQEIFNKIENKKKLINQERQRLSRKLVNDIKHDKLAMTEQVTNSFAHSSLETDKILENAKQSLLKRSSARRAKYLEETKLLNEKYLSQEEYQMANTGNRKRWLQQQQQKMSPFTPFNGDRDPVNLFELQDQYYDPYTMDLLKDSQYMAGGVRVEQIYKKSLFEAFCGLECIIREEKA